MQEHTEMAFALPEFPVGNALRASGEDIWTFLQRHQYGDWGDVSEEDRRLNNEALQLDGRLMSAYHTSTKVKIWVITEWNRSMTTVLLPSEY